MIPAQVELTFYQGSDIDVLLEWVDSATNQPVNLEGYSALATFRTEVNSESELFTLSSEDGGIIIGETAGTILLTGPSPNASVFEQPIGEWDLFVISGDVRTVVCRGSAKFIKSVTR